MDGKFHGRKFYLERHVITIEAGGTESKAVIFEDAFVNAPRVFINEPEGAAGTYTATPISKTGFTIEVSGETEFASSDIVVFVFVMEKA